MSNYVLLEGDCLEQLKNIPDESVDSLISDPPAFIDFMGKGWDGTDILWKYLWSNSTFVNNVARFLKRILVERNTEGLNSALKNANTKALNLIKSAQVAQSAVGTLQLISPQVNGSVALLALTKQEVLDLSQGQLQNLISHKDIAPGGINDACYVIPLLLPESEAINTVPKSVVTSIKKHSKSGQTIQLTLTDVQRLSDAIEGQIGIRLEALYLNETTAPASIAARDRLAEKFNVTILRPTDLQEITPYLTLLLSALVVTEKSKNIQSYLASNFMECVMKEALRVLKPGAHGLVWAIPRTSHWTATALEDAGFEIRDAVTHLFGSGFPKSMDISKAIDKAAGAEREVIGHAINSYPDSGRKDMYRDGGGKVFDQGDGLKQNVITAPSTQEAKQWQGFGTALKPASEHWILVRKPLGEKTVAANVLKYGTGGINIDASRIETDGSRRMCGTYEKSGQTSYTTGARVETHVNQGRFPANLVLSHNKDCEDTCTEGCAVAELDRQSGVSKSTANQRNNKPSENISMSGANTGHVSYGHNDHGGASRFFYCAKASKADKNAGCEGLEKKLTLAAEFRPNHTEKALKGEDGNPYCRRTPAQNNHPTVKSTKLMSYLIKLITPPNGLVLAPFTGSGTTGVAALKEGFAFIGVEKEPEYANIAIARLNNAAKATKEQHAEANSEQDEEAAS
jgi:site-specific DNA-methyltransferase (adenine-specific)